MIMTGLKLYLGYVLGQMLITVVVISALVLFVLIAGTLSK